MKKQFSIFLAIIFLAVQMGSFVHMAEHGFESHEHGNNPCQVEACFHASHSFDNAISEIAISHNSSIEEIDFALIDSSQRVIELSSTKLARAPPYNS